LAWRFKNGDVPGVALVNVAAATSGADAETLDELELRARARLLATERAVTLRDIEAIAEATPGAFVARATAIANCPHRETITVVAVPKVRPGRTGSPKAPSPAFLDAVRRCLQRRRLLCDDIRVAPPRYVKVRVTARLRLVKGAGAAAVLERARTALDTLLTGGVTASDPCPTLWPFGRSVFPSEVYGVLDEVAGVDFVSSLMLSGTADGEAVAADTATGALPIGRTGLVVPDLHDLAVDAGGRSAR
jgi:predicted phage baseplate assembly protein